MDKVKVLHLTTLHPSNDVRIYEKEALSLSKAGYKVIVAGPKPKPTSEDVSWISIPTPNRFRLLRIILSQLFACYAIIRSRARIIHIHDPEILISANLIRRFSKRVFIWDAHEDYYRQLDRWGIYKNPLRNLFSQFLGVLLGKVLSITSSQFHLVIGATQEICIQYKNKNIIIVGNEVILKNFESCNPKFENNQVLLLSNSSSDPFLLVLAKAVAKIPSLRLVVAGAAQSVDTLELATKLLGDRFRHDGRLDRQTLAQTVTQSGVGIIAYSDIITNRTNSPNKFFEFAAAGLPVVCTPNESLQGLLSQSRSGLLLRDYSAEAFELALLKVFESKEEWLQMSKSGAFWAKEHGNWDASRLRLINAYKLLASHSVPENK
jgi:glycosyltransferase involved in cell wall biosynthesis